VLSNEKCDSSRLLVPFEKFGSAKGIWWPQGFLHNGLSTTSAEAGFRPEPRFLGWVTSLCGRRNSLQQMGNEPDYPADGAVATGIRSRHDPHSSLRMESVGNMTAKLSGKCASRDDIVVNSTRQQIYGEHRRYLSLLYHCFSSPWW
jgi:hypothetical protein